ncbi:MAG TPA: crotonase/enoyl-CoA hydratase family protein [Acidimicrobiia bacterium]|jgi:enoyl-CoA hydratase
MSDEVQYDVHDKIAHVTIDHGKANTLSTSVVAALDAALTSAEQAGPDDVAAMLITGKPGFLSGGFDLDEMRASAESAFALTTKGGSLFTRFFGSDVPIVVACTGHAIAAGALLLLSADERIGARGPFRIGLIETQIGMVVPRWATELSEERLSRRHYQLATIGARIYDPDGARDAGFLDEVVEPDDLVARATEAVQYWAGLPRAAYVGQLKRHRADRLRRLDEAVVADRGALYALSQ